MSAPEKIIARNGRHCNIRGDCRVRFKMAAIIANLPD